MGIFGSVQSPAREFQARVNQSVYGFPVPVVLGTGQIQQSILWVDGFSSKKAPAKGGKGFGGKSGGYIYSADVVAALCAGPILGVGDVWAGQSWLGSPTAAESYTIGSPYTYTVANGSAFYNDLGVGMQGTASGSYSDLGAPYATVISATLYASMVAVPSSPTTGQYSYDPATGVYTFSSADAGKTVSISYSYLLKHINQQQRAIVPAGQTISVGAEGSGTYVLADEGVTYASGVDEGTAFKKVSGSPSTGQYYTSGTNPMVYHFASGDVGALVTLTWQEYEPNAVSPGEAVNLNYTLNNGTKGQSPFSFLTSSYPDAAFGYTSIATLLYQPMDLGMSSEIQQNKFEVATGDIYGGGIQDCNPVQCLGRVLTDSVWGLGAGPVPFPSSVIDNGSSGTWGGPASIPGQLDVAGTAWNWFAAQNFFISPVIDGQDTAASACSKWLEAGMCAAFMSEGLLKLVPYGDTTAAGNGCTWTAPTAFVVALDDTDFLTVEGKDPVKISRVSTHDAWNVIQVQWDNRQNQYAPEITQESDQGLINRWGERREDPQDWSFIHTITAATFAANMRVKHNAYTRNAYEFSLPYSYSYLEPMDIVSISTGSVWAGGLNNLSLGVTDLPVRITKIVDDPKSGLQVTCEDYLWGAHQPTLYNKQQASAEVPANAYADPGNSEVVMFEATNRLTQFKGNEIWIGALGTSTNWGSCNIFVSQDGTDYIQVGTIKFPAKLGSLASTFNITSPVTDPDTTDSLVVDLATNCGTMTAGTTTDADNDMTLCFVDGELISYSALTYTNQQQVTMDTYIRRGQMGSSISSHASSSLFMLLDSSIFKYTYDPTWAGQTLYFKFQSVNQFGFMAQDLSTLSAVTFTIPGDNPGSIDASTGILFPQYNTAIYEGAWSSSFSYVEGNIVDLSGSIYQCILPNTNHTPPNATYWALISAANSSVFAGAYNSGTAYAVGNQVTYNQNYYICLLASTGNAPTNGTYWQQIGTSYQFLSTYNSGTAYVPGNEVSYNGSTWICISAGTGQTPSTTSAYWTLIGTAAILLGAWSSSVAYVSGNQVIFNGNIYSCIVANTNEEPDTNPTYWTIIGSQSLASIPPTGSISPIVCNPFSYTSTPSSITISWTGQTISLVNGTTISVGSGSQTITGLTANTSYAFFPLWDTATSAIVFIDAADVASLQNLNGCQFNGTSSEVTTTNSFSNPTGAWSIEYWIYTTDTTVNPSPVESNANKTGTPSATTLGPGVSYPSNGSGGYPITPYNTTTSYEYGPQPLTSQWHHIAVSYAGAGLAYVYVDGVQTHLATFSASAASGTRYWRIGRSGFLSGLPWFAGILAHLAVYNGIALSQAQVANHYSTMVDAGPTAYATVVEGDSPTSYWKLNEATGTSAADSSSTGTNTGTYVSCTLNQGSAIGAAVGSPAIAWLNPPSAVALAQYEQANYPMSAGATGFTAATTASGTGGGLVGGFTIPGLPYGFQL